MPSSRRERHPRKAGLLDRATFRRAQNEYTVRLRKQKKEERLAARRQLGNLTATGAVARDTTTLQHTLQALCAESFDQNQFEHQLPLLLNELTETGSASVSLLSQLLENHPESAKRLVERLLPYLTKTELGEVALRILAVLSSPEASPSSASNENYYGAASPRWADFLIAHSEEIVHLWREKHIGNSTWSAWISDLVAQDATVWSSWILRDDDRNLWPRLVHALPQTLPVCAAVLYYDASKYGMSFLRDLTALQLAQLLASTALDSVQRTEVAWMVEGLARREPLAVRALLDSEAGLIAAITSRLLQSDVLPAVLLPLWRALGHFAVANNGSFVQDLLSHQSVIHAGVMLLQQARNIPTTVVVEGLDTLACLLFDVGTANHLSTTIAAPAWVPRLANLVSSTAVYDIQCHAWQAMSVALCPPPNCENTFVESQVHELVTKDPHALRSLLQALHDVVTRPDLHVQKAALDVLEQLLHQSCSPVLLLWIEIDGGKDGTVTLGHLSVNGADVVAEQAGRLLDMYFDEDENEDVAATFSFDIPAGQSPTQAFSAMSPPQIPQIGQGRGRGRVLPAWMSKQSS